MMQGTERTGQPWSQPDRLNYATTEFDKQEWATVESHRTTMDDPGETFGEQEWTRTNDKNAFTVADFDEAPDDGGVSNTKDHDFDADDPTEIHDDWTNRNNSHHEAVDNSDGHPKWEIGSVREFLMAKLKSRLRFDAIKRNENLLKCLGQQHILQQIVKPFGMLGKDDFEPSQLVRLSLIHI